MSHSTLLFGACALSGGVMWLICRSRTPITRRRYAATMCLFALWFCFLLWWFHQPKPKTIRFEGNGWVTNQVFTNGVFSNTVNEYGGRQPLFYLDANKRFVELTNDNGVFTNAEVLNWKTYARGPWDIDVPVYRLTNDSIVPTEVDQQAIGYNTNGEIFKWDVKTRKWL